MGGWVQDGRIGNAPCTAPWPMDSQLSWDFCCAVHREALFPTRNTRERIPFQSQKALHVSPQEDSLPRDARGV